MRTGEILAAAFWVAIALGAVWAGADLGLGILTNPGSGLMIFWVGVVMTALSLATLVIAASPARPRWAGQPLAWHTLVAGAVCGGAARALRLAHADAGLPHLYCAVPIHSVHDDRPAGWVARRSARPSSRLLPDIVFHRGLGTQLPVGEVEHWLTTHLPIVFGRG